MGRGTDSNWAIILSDWVIGSSVAGASVSDTSVADSRGIVVSSGFLGAAAIGFFMGASSASRF